MVRCFFVAGAMAALATTASGAAAPAQTHTTPVLLVPRFRGASQTGQDEAHDDSSFAFVRSASPDSLQLKSYYDGVVSQLESAGYVKGHTLIPAPFDWRQDVVPQSTVAYRDGQVTGLLARWQDPANAQSYTYATDYLRRWLIEAVRKNPGTQQVDIVGHATGAPVVMAYVQSDAYGKPVLDEDGNTVQLPTVRKLVTASMPFQGSVFALNSYHNNFMSKTKNELCEVYAKAYSQVTSGSAIPGSDGNITMASIDAPTEDAREANFVRQYSRFISSILPTKPTAYVQAGNGTMRALTCEEMPDGCSNLLLDLGAASTPGNNPWATRVQQTYATYPVRALKAPHTEGAPELRTVSSLVAHTGESGVNAASFSDCARGTSVPTKAGNGRVYFVDVHTPGGEGLFTRDSMQGDLFDQQGNPDPNVVVKQFGNGDAPANPAAPKDDFTPTNFGLGHREFISNPDVAAWIAQTVSSN